MKITNAILIGAGCPLADTLAATLAPKMNIVGVSQREFDSIHYNNKIVTDFLDEDKINNNLLPIIESLESFVVITCCGRFPIRKNISDYFKKDDLKIFESNVLGFLVPFRASISKARKVSLAAYVTFGSVSQFYNYPKLGVYTAAKDALRSIVRTASHEEAKYGVRFFHFNLSTLEQDKELCFTSTDVGDFLPCSTVAHNVEHFLDGIKNAPFFTEAQIYIYSDAYYSEGYLSRIPDKE